MSGRVSCELSVLAVITISFFLTRRFYLARKKRKHKYLTWKHSKKPSPPAGVLSTNAMSTTSTKRKSDLLSPPVNETQKRYQWCPENLIKQNKYYIPNDHNLEATTSKTTEPSQSQLTKKNKIPPIFLQLPINHSKLINDIKAIAKNEFSTLNTAKSLKINLTTEDDYRSLTKHYQSNNIPFHTFRNSNEKPYSVVIKNVPPSLSQKNVENDLKQHNLPILKITRLYYKDRTPMPIFAVDLAASEEAKEIYTKVKDVCKALVTIKPRKSLNVIDANE